MQTQATIYSQLAEEWDVRISILGTLGAKQYSVDTLMISLD
jgi:hypothetical protein